MKDYWITQAEQAVLRHSAYAKQKSKRSKDQPRQRGALTSDWGDDKLGGMRVATDRLADVMQKHNDVLEGIAGGELGVICAREQVTVDAFSRYITPSQ